MVSFTFAKGRRAVPLRWMTGNTADDDLTDKFVALITEESQGFSSLVGVLVKSLVTIVGDSRVWTWVIFYCSQHTKHTEDSHVRAADSKHAEISFINRRGQLRAGRALTDTLWAAVAPFGGTSVSSVARDLAGTFQLITLVTGETNHCPNGKACFGAHGACSVYHLSWVRALLYCRGQN